jgi:hypothetical protein
MTTRLFAPSYNRPLQLYALLESILKYDKLGLFSHIRVCYAGTTDELKIGYDKLINHSILQNKVEFVPKSGSHYKDIMSSFDEPIDFWAMTTDDSLFYRPFSLTEKQLNEVMTDSVDHFSFRLGYNTTVLDYENPEKKHELRGDNIQNDLVRFYKGNHTGHYGHSFAIDSYLSHTEYIKQLIIRACSPVGFNYSYMESKLGDYLRSGGNKPFVICPKQSWLVNSPNNKVFDGPYLKNGVKFPYTVEELNQKWLDGYKIDLSKIDGSIINSVQQEIDYKFCLDH